ncbi:MAG: VWA domain-containing protein [Candidatus Latescibacteria bacterium]|jgi:Ca-activated chloride channel family protein|nr:VWA domain-containing protein [Candidatus Latescibacterota bacterium]
MTNVVLDALLEIWAEPWAFWMLALVPVVLMVFAIAMRQRKAALALFGNLALVSRMAGGIDGGRRVVKAVVLVAANVFLVLAAARPQWGSELQLAQQEGVDIALLIDVSYSMLAQDIRPSRLDWARHGISGLLNRLEGDRITLIPFTRKALILYPLTLDYGAIRTLLPNLGPELFSEDEQGTALGEAIKTASRVFDQQSRKYKVIILMSDGEDQAKSDPRTRAPDPVEQAEAAADQGVVIYTVGIASPKGELIPNSKNSGDRFLKDSQGSVVRTRLDEDKLRRIALATGGAYYRTTLAQDELDEIYDDISSMEKKEQQSLQRTHREDRYPVPLAICIFLLVIEMLVPDRRRSLSDQTGDVRA